MLSIQALVFGSHKCFLWLKTFRGEHDIESPVFHIELVTFEKSISEANPSQIHASSTNTSQVQPDQIQESKPGSREYSKEPKDTKTKAKSSSVLIRSVPATAIQIEPQLPNVPFVEESQLPYTPSPRLRELKMQSLDLDLHQQRSQMSYPDVGSQGLNELKTQSLDLDLQPQLPFLEPKAMKILGLGPQPLQPQDSYMADLQPVPLPPKFAICRNPTMTIFIPFGLITFLLLFLEYHYSESITGFHGYLYNIFSCFFVPLIFLMITPKLQRFIFKKLSCKL